MSEFGSPADIDDLAQALLDAAGELGDANTGGTRAAQELSGSLTGTAGPAVETSWSGIAGRLTTLANACTSGNRALADYASAMASARASATAAAVLVDTYGLRLSGDTVCPPDQTHLPDSDRTPGLQTYADQANQSLQTAASTMQSAGQAVVAALNGLRADFGDHRTDTYTPDPAPTAPAGTEVPGGEGDKPDTSSVDVGLILAATGAGVAGAPADGLDKLNQDVEAAAKQAAAYRRMSRSGNPAVRAKGKAGLAEAKATKSALAEDLENAEKSDLGTYGKGIVAKGLGTTAADIPGLEDLKYGEKIPLVGVVLTGVGIVYDHSKGQSWTESGLVNGSSFVAGTVVTGVITSTAVGGAITSGALAIGATGLVAAAAPVVIGVVVGGAVAYGVGKGAEAIWDHRKGIEHAASSAYKDVKSWF